MPRIGPTQFSKPKVAVTGGVAVGKSTVLGFFAEMGCSTASADDVAAEVLAEPEIRSSITTALSLDPDWGRADLREAILAEPSARRALNKITHPVIMERLMSLDIDVMEVPLLHEACLGPLFSDVICVLCSYEEQVSRLMDRLGDEAEVGRLIGAQLNLYSKAILSDEMIRTDCPVHIVRMDVQTIAQRIFG